MTTKTPQIPDRLRQDWNRTYSETDYRQLPWFSARPSAWVSTAVDEGWWPRRARILDVGCGAGSNSLFLARAGYRVTGIDLAEGAIAAARARAARAGLAVEFRVADALRVPFPRGEFDGALDIGCFHTLPIPLRAAYARELARLVRPGGSFALLWMARESRNKLGPPHRPSLGEVTAALEEQFVFRRTDYHAAWGGHGRNAAPPVYGARLERRASPRPPAR